VTAPRTSNAGPLSPELAGYLRELAAVRADATELLGGLSEVQLNWRSTPKRWSIAQNLTHLVVIGRLYLPQFDSAIQRAREKGWRKAGPFEYGAIGNWVIAELEPPPRHRMRAPRMFKPQPVQPLAHVRDAFLELQGEFEQRVHAANGIDLRRAKVATVFSSLLRLPLGQAFQAMLAHERRHLWQARNVRTAAGFPGA
jgi:hypothetical protein